MRIRLLKIFSPILRPAYRRYVSRKRPFRYGSVRVIVYPGVFYPGFVFSTGIFLDYLSGLDLPGKTVLEIGAGSGIISLVAGTMGARVTASDINPEAVRNIRDNARLNGLELRVIRSDLFKEIPTEGYDFILVTPPYYPLDPAGYSEMAWYCGKDYGYFDNYFRQLGDFCDEATMVLMILSEDCNLAEIRERAGIHGFSLDLVHRKKKMQEWHYIFRIKKRVASV